MKDFLMDEKMAKTTEENLFYWDHRYRSENICFMWYVSHEVAHLQ